MNSVSRGEEPVVRPAVGLVVPDRLALADRHRAAVVAGRLEEAERGEIDVRDGERPRLGGRRREVGCGLEAAEGVRLLEDHGGCVVRRRRQSPRVGRPTAVRDLHDLHAEPRRVGLHDLAYLRVERLREHDLRAARVVARDEACVGGDRGAVVAGRVRHVHPRQLADRGLVLEDGLQDALAHLRLVRRVRGEELAAGEKGVGDRGDVVVVDPHPEEAQLARRVGVAPGELLQMPDERRLGQRLRDVERTAEPHPLRDLLEEGVDRVDPDRLEHRLTVGRR